LSDGFAITQLEAMAYGLPVIATPNCGRVVTAGVDGQIIPPRNSEALAKAIGSYIGNLDCLSRHGAFAKRKAQEFSLHRVTHQLLELGQCDAFIGQVRGDD
jgi:glycosyltransferase involved in cell wall biosynthesis